MTSSPEPHPRFRQTPGRQGTRRDTAPNMQMKKVGNYLIDMEKALGQGQYGKVYLAREILDHTQFQQSIDSAGTGLT